ncbi:hypothetical protein L6452_16613 [Arctium lappa]|uniref:Uncharacterized protein n=1 Tax=Arctium lappa TaxID=4217 RepID=A0ACB9C174_ARCLA|nr:hypothetical protein L6452_16613 [Arctium lappa]
MVAISLDLEEEERGGGVVVEVVGDDVQKYNQKIRSTCTNQIRLFIPKKITTNKLQKDYNFFIFFRYIDLLTTNHN